MATPLVQALVTKTGRRVFQNAKGRFISKSTYLRELRRIPKGMKNAGRFMSREQFARGASAAQIADRLEALFGPPLGDGDWLSRVRRSSERFRDFQAGQNALG